MRAPKALAVIAVALLAAGSVTGRAHAQDVAQEAPPPVPTLAEVAAQLAGAYHLTNADGDRSCALTLGGRPLARGETEFPVEFDRQACAERIMFSADIAKWAPGPGNAIRLFSGNGRLIAEFTEGVGGSWEALRETDGVYFLTNPRIADPAAQPADIVGLWDLARTGGNARCRIEFGDAAIQGGAFRLAPQPGCTPLLGRAAPDRWRLDRGDLVLENAEGGQLRFAPNDEGGWMKVPEDARPLTLNRAP